MRMDVVSKITFIIILVGRSKSICISIDNKSEEKKTNGLFEIFKMAGKAKHEPCGEHWDVTYGESAWRLAVMAMCLSPDFDRKRLVKMALTSAFTW